MKVLIVQNQPVIEVDEKEENLIKSKYKNFEIIENLIAKFKSQNPDLIILPELFSTGWFPPLFQKSSEEKKPSITLKFLSSLAKEFNSNLVGGSLIFKENSEFKNVCPIFNRCGELIGRYEKNHLFSQFEQAEGKYLKAGEKGAIVKTDVGNLGISICYDLRFPELFRAYTYAGADILINIAAWGSKRYEQYKTLLKARAIENQIFAFGVCQTGEIQNGECNSGGSLAVNPFGDIIKSLKENSFNEETSGAMLVEIDLKEQEEFRKKISTLKDKKNNYEIEFFGV